MVLGNVLTLITYEKSLVYTFRGLDFFRFTGLPGYGLKGLAIYLDLRYLFCYVYSLSITGLGFSWDRDWSRDYYWCWSFYCSSIHHYWSRDILDRLLHSRLVITLSSLQSLEQGLEVGRLRLRLVPVVGNLLRQLLDLCLHLLHPGAESLLQPVVGGSGRDEEGPRGWGRGGDGGPLDGSGGSTLGDLLDVLDLRPQLLVLLHQTYQQGRITPAVHQGWVTPVVQQGRITSGVH